MEITIDFPESPKLGHKVTAQIGNHIILTDQPKSYGADDSAPAPFLLFLGSIATCSAWFLLRFLETRAIPLEGISIKMVSSMNKETKLIPEIKFVLTVPPDFPEKYRKPAVMAMHQCAVTRHLIAPPRFVADVVVGDAVVLSTNL